MLQLKEITKVYGTGSGAVQALCGVDLNFRKSEFVAILGPSGCGKTTLLNVIGGLDQYTSGDLIINNRSTKEFRDADWDAYRNHSVGFVFQSYNLIPHQTVLANVELALTLSGVSKAERRRRAADALRRVGLADQLHKKPNQMSGGQMQRVAIARALVNDPDILLADEPTGALDSTTSLQIMEILREISKDKLIVMVTHNPELAEQYANRTIRLLDGRVMGDTNPYTPSAEELAATPAPLTRKEQKKKKDPKTKRTSMSFFTALSLSFNNLMTKKARTFLTSFAGSIGIIGIALILSVSNGVNAYINSVQEETLSSYPITLQAETMDMSSMLLSLMSSSEEQEGTRDPDKIYSNIVMYQLMNSFINAETRENNLGAFLKYMQQHPDQFADHATAIQSLYDISFDVYTTDVAGNTVPVDASEVFRSVLGDVSSSSMMSSYSSMMSSSSSMEIWQELIPGKEDEDGVRPAVSDMLKEQYQLLSGEWPDAYDEVVLIVNSKNELSDMTLYALGLKDRSELSDIMAAILAQQTYDAVVESWSYDEIRSLGLSLVLPTDYYTEATKSGDAKRSWIRTENTDSLAAAGVPLKITGIISPAEGSTSTALSGSLGYTYHLTEYVIGEVLDSEIVRYQSLPENENYDVLTGLPFSIDETNDKSDAEKHALFLSYVQGLSDSEKYELLLAIRGEMPDAMLAMTVNGQMSSLLAEGATMADPRYDRTKMEDFIRSMMAMTGADVSSDLVSKYIARLNDNDLAALIRSSLESATKEMYRQNVVNSIEAELDKLSYAELTIYKADMIDRFSLTDRAAREAYLLANRALLSPLAEGEYAALLATYTDEEIDNLLDKLLGIQASAALTKDEAYRAKKAAAMLDAYLTGLSAGAASQEARDATFAALYEKHMPSGASKSTLQDNLSLLGAVDRDAPDRIVIYMATFDDKELITDGIADYNASVSDDADKINYTDFVALLISSVTTIINAISYVLIAFVAISLVVSSIMIGIITYISVLERTKEIGILRAIGASKRDVSSVFNAETLTIGFVAGAIGIGVTLFFVVIINVILFALTGLPNLQAALPWQGALVLILISMGLTVIAGLFPARLAAKKDPVVALRTE